MSTVITGDELKGNKKQVLEQFNEIVNGLREERGLPVKELQST